MKRHITLLKIKLYGWLMTPIVIDILIWFIISQMIVFRFFGAKPIFGQNSLNILNEMKIVKTNAD